MKQISRLESDYTIAILPIYNKLKQENQEKPHTTTDYLQITKTTIEHTAIIQTALLILN